MPLTILSLLDLTDQPCFSLQISRLSLSPSLHKPLYCFRRNQGAQDGALRFLRRQPKDRQKQARKSWRISQLLRQQAQHSLSEDSPRRCHQPNAHVDGYQIAIFAKRSSDICQDRDGQKIARNITRWTSSDDR